MDRNGGRNGRMASRSVTAGAGGSALEGENANKKHASHLGDEFDSSKFPLCFPGGSASGPCCLNGKRDRYLRMSLTRSGFDLLDKRSFGL